MLTPREQGDFGELSAAYWLASRGATLALPLGTNRHWDLIAELDGRVLRVQVKRPGAVAATAGRSRFRRAAVIRVGMALRSCSILLASTTSSFLSGMAGVGLSRQRGSTAQQGSG